MHETPGTSRVVVGRGWLRLGDDPTTQARELGWSVGITKLTLVVPGQKRLTFDPGAGTLLIHRLGWPGRAQDPLAF